MKIEIVEGHVTEDHVHICLAIPPKYAVSEAIGKFKGKTAIRMFNKYPELRKRYCGSHFWSSVYYANTVSKNEDMIREYIRNQDKLNRLENQGNIFR